jgi:hypothetical protein
VNPKQWDLMENWEKELDQFDWKKVLKEVDQALIENLAAELGFPSFEKLEQASELVVGDYYICHLSDGRWVWWNPTTYATEDPIYFRNKKEAMKYIADFLKLDDEKKAQLKKGLDRVVQTKRCRYCEHEFHPKDPGRSKWDRTGRQTEFCSPECAAEAVIDELKEDFSG